MLIIRWFCNKVQDSVLPFSMRVLIQVLFNVICPEISCNSIIIVFFLFYRIIFLHSALTAWNYFPILHKNQGHKPGTLIRWLLLKLRATRLHANWGIKNFVPIHLGWFQLPDLILECVVLKLKFRELLSQLMNIFEVRLLVKGQLFCLSLPIVFIIDWCSIVIDGRCSRDRSVEKSSSLLGFAYWRGLLIIVLWMDWVLPWSLKSFEKLKWLILLEIISLINICPGFIVWKCLGPFRYKWNLIFHFFFHIVHDFCCKKTFGPIKSWSL